MAGVSRESVNRLENATGRWDPRPRKTAQILSVLDVTEQDVREAIPEDPQLQHDVIQELAKLSTTRFTEYINRQAASVIVRDRADLVLISPAGVTVVAEIKAAPRQAGVVRREIADALVPAGWVVTSPV
jgi:hypothetical protein